jgi:hypothetical protein
MARVSCYVDGFNLYHAIDELGRHELKWLNLRRVAQSVCGHGDELAGVSYFTAIQSFDQEKNARHREYIRALEANDVDACRTHHRPLPSEIRLSIDNVTRCRCGELLWVDL